MLLLFRNKELPKDEWLLLLVRSSKPFENPDDFWEEREKDEYEESGAKDTLFPESTLSSILNANNRCLSSLWLHSSPLDPKVSIMKSRLIHFNNFFFRNLNVPYLLMRQKSQEITCIHQT